MPSTVEVRRGRYYDSVSLMQVSATVGRLGGVEAALVAMGTDLNLDLLAGMDFPTPQAGPSDLILAIRAGDDDALVAALATADDELAAMSRGGTTGSGGMVPPLTIGSAARRIDATVAVVSVPGPNAFVEAMDALDAGLSVMVFSDNVPVAAEVALKVTAARRDLLVMGPDCGTAVIDGVGLGFANVVAPGPVSLVAASGTGAQELMSLLDAAGVGVRHCLGVGGRDLSSAIGGRSTLAALAALDADPGTELIVVVSKPPAREVASDVRRVADQLATPVALLLLGEGNPDLTAGAERVLTGLGRPVPAWPSWHPDTPPAPARDVPGGRDLRGLFSGGTLCDEAMLIASATLGPIASNIPLRPEWALGPDLRTPGHHPSGHLMIDFGDDTLTRGRAHPMIDPTLRLERLTAELADPATGAVLLDVVLGHAAHPDPATAIAAVIAGSTVPVVVSLCGTAGDPQGLTRQAATLVAAGAEVYLSNAAAARRAVDLVAATPAMTDQGPAGSSFDVGPAGSKPAFPSPSVSRKDQ